MAHPVTEKCIKKPILALLAEPSFLRKIHPAKENGNPREFPLQALHTTFRADFAYRIVRGGWLFIEDDSDKTCLSNLLKYSAWIREAKPELPVHVVHIISPKDSGWIRLCELQRKKLVSEIEGFNHAMIKTKDWPEHDPAWLRQLRRLLKDIL